MSAACSLWTIHEAAAFLRMSVEAVAELVARGDLPGAVKVGGGVLFRRVELRAHLGLPAVSTSVAAESAARPNEEALQRPKAERRPRALTRPAREVSDHVAAQAARVLKERGFT